MRWLVLAAALIGTAIGLAWPSETRGGTTGQLFDAWYAIPSGSSGQSSVLVGNWHGGYCPPSGDACALDWGPTDTVRRIEFRGAFKRSGPSDYSLHTHQYPIHVDDPKYCDDFAADVYENHLEFVHGDHSPRWGIHFLHGHALASLPYAFNILTTSTGYGSYNSFYLGNMMDTSDAGVFCDWHFIHVHDELWLGQTCPGAGLPGYDKRGDLQQGTAYQNSTTWTRHTQWGEGGYVQC